MAAAPGLAVPRANVSASAYAWLSKLIRVTDPGLWDSWWEPVENLVNGGSSVLNWGPSVLSSESWPHDFWVAQGARYLTGGLFIQTWRHRRPLDDWPLLGIGAADLAPGGMGQATNAGALDRILASAGALSYEHDRQLAPFHSYLAASTAPIHLAPGRVEIDPRRLKANVVRAWLDLILGSSLTGLVLSPIDNPELLGGETRRRLKVAWPAGGGPLVPQVSLAHAIEALYATKWDNGQPTLMVTRRGHALWMRDHWFWLGRPVEAGELREAIQVTAGLLVSPPLAEALLAVIGDGNDSGLAGLCVLRRWVLGLRVMAWLEEAFRHEWHDVRLADVTGFAYAAIAPWWPRPVIAISHRSADAKPVLKNLRMWGDAHVAVDAMVIPDWESNTGFVWRLFAATPVVIRVQSASYQASTWCRRETELTQYLLEHSDFLRGRVVADAAIPQLPALDRVVAQLSSAVQPSQVPPASAGPGFPLDTAVLDVPSYPSLVIKLLAAVCTLRLMNAMLENANVVNIIARRLAQGEDVPAPAPTNDPGGWKMHQEAFRALARYGRKDEAPVRLAAGYPELQRQLDVSDVLQSIPDLRGSTQRGIDLLAGLEWNREIRRWFTECWNSWFVSVDCRGLKAKRWSADENHSIKRGIVALRTESQVFITQNAGQDVERWPVIEGRDSPILTQHVAGQLRWMVRVIALPTWIAAYLSLPDFEFEPNLVKAVYGALAGEFRRYKGLTAPVEYADIFMAEVGPGSPFFATPSRIQRRW